MCKIFTLFLSFMILGVGVDAFLKNSIAQDVKGAYKEHIKQPRVKTGRIITVGDHGQCKGSDGLQLALNMALDRDEIRIERGAFKVSPLSIAESKVWKRGIRISGGWDETFTKKSNNTDYTTLEGNSFTISKKVFIENIVFKNNTVNVPTYGIAAFSNCIFKDSVEGGAVNGSGITFHNCVFTNNSARNGGAVIGYGMTFYNCAFISNSARQEGGAVFGELYSGGTNTFHNCTFANNSADIGGALVGNGTFHNCIFANNRAFRCGAIQSNKSIFSNCIFTNNSAETAGGAICGSKSINKCTFYGNKAKENTGAVGGVRSIFNSIFYKNTAAGKGSDISGGDDLKIDFSLFNYLSEGADVGKHVIMGDPKFVGPDNGDLHLRPDSPCIDKGKRPSKRKSTTSFTSKPDVEEKGINMGADEAALTLALKYYQRTLEAKIANKNN